MAAMRRNINVKLFVHDNQITASPRAAVADNRRGNCFEEHAFRCAFEQFNPMALAVALDCSFAPGDMPLTRGISRDL